MNQWRKVRQQVPNLDDLEQLRQLDEFYPDDSSVLQIKVTTDDVMMIAGDVVYNYLE